MSLLINEFIKIAKTNKGQDLLRSINYNSKSNYIGVTDRHRALLSFAENVQNTFSVNIDTMQFETGHYPDLTKILPTGTQRTISFMPKSNWKMIKGYASFEVPFLSIKDDKLTFANVEFATIENSENLKIHFNAKLFFEMLDFIYKVDKMTGDWIITYSDEMHPISLTNGVYTYALTPVRTF